MKNQTAPTLLDLYVRACAAFEDGGLTCRKYGAKERSMWTTNQHKLFETRQRLEDAVYRVAAYFPEGTLSTVLMVEYEKETTYEEAAETLGYVENKDEFIHLCNQFLRCFEKD